jgi:membrane fusion protein (multidrug efflux system)
MGSDWVIDTGLQPGEMVVVDGLQKVLPGATVKPVFATERVPSDEHRG